MFPLIGLMRVRDVTNGSFVGVSVRVGLHVRMTMAAAVVAAWGGCSGATAKLDAAVDADTDGPVAKCSTATVCDGMSTVRACTGGFVGEKIEECVSGLACSRGRCTTLTCANVEAQPNTFLGCRFYTLQVDNVGSENSGTSSVLVTNPGPTEVTVNLEERGNGGWMPVQTATIAPVQSQRIPLPPRLFEGGGYGPRAALRVSTDNPVTAEHIQGDDAAETASSSGGTMLLPVQALGRRYMAITYPQADEPKIDQTSGSRGGAGQVIILGTEDMTHAVFQVSATASLGDPGGAPPRPPGGSFDINLSDGDFYQIFSIAEGDDLTGSLITSDQAVAVFSGNISTTYGQNATGINTPDMAHEQLLPETSWGTRFIAAALPPQAKVCDSVLGVPGASLWRIVAARDGTTVQFDAPAGVVGTPPLGPGVSLAAGGVFETIVAGGSFTVTASGPVQVMQGIDCEPTLSAAINATAPMLTDLRFPVLPNFDQLASIVRPAGAPITLDEAVVPDAMFAAAGGGFEVAQIPLPGCPSTNVVCTHHLAGEFGITLRGMDVVCSYALTAPTWIYCADPTTPGCVP
jgi:hypothetical protein